MSKQLGFSFANSAPPAQTPVVAPPKLLRQPEAFDEYPKGKALEPGDEVTMIHRLGNTRRVRVGGIVKTRIHVIWPVANDTLELSVRSGVVVVPKDLSDWRLEPNALEMAKVLRGYAILDSKIAVE